MKNLLLFLLVFSSWVTFCQISLEHSYNEGTVTRVKLEYSGEKYFLFKVATNELVFYNANHTYWKTIVLPAPLPTTYTRTTIFHVSEAKINPDTNLEIIFGYYNASSSFYESKIIAEDGTVLLTIPNALSVSFSEIGTLTSKLLTKNTVNNVNSKVYSVPELILENTYTDGEIERVNLENSGEKYYLLDKVNGQAKVYNQNHSLWKTISLPKPLAASYSGINIVSESQINPDALLEIGYTYYSVTGSSSAYEGRLVNENNTVLFSIPQAAEMYVSVLEGCENKLIATIRNDSGSVTNSSNVYQLPTFVLENSYESIVSRVKLENSGEKYYTSVNPLNGFAKIYNENHTPWKTIFLETPDDFYRITTVNFISETVINQDPLIELSYSCESYHYLYPEYQSRIMNENGLTFITVNDAIRLDLNELPGINPKIVGVMHVFSFDGPYLSYGTVYSVNPLDTADFENVSKNVIFPNPASLFLNLQSFEVPIMEAAIYNMNGALLKHEISQNITKIDIEKLPTGMYVLHLMNNRNQKSTHKITILH